MKDALGDRIKSQYEDRTRFLLPRRTYTIIRVDGKAFHTLTRGFTRPFDRKLMTMMDNTAMAMCKEMQGAALAYVQSDEISVLLTDFSKITTNAWFDGNVQKMASIAAACATANFNMEMLRNNYFKSDSKLAMFDARVFTIPDATEVENYFIWRQNDASRNSVQMVARSLYSHKELEGKGVPQLHDLIHAKNKNWNNYTSGEKRGRCIVKQQINKAAEYKGFQNGQAASPDTVLRNEWVSLSGDNVPAVPMGYNGPELTATNQTPIFTQDRSFLRGLIPTFEK
jgi:tRNA(His) guanylyltransferase